MSGSSDPTSKISRRTALEGSIAVAGIAGLSNTVSALTNGQGPRLYRGITYDSVTMTEQGKAQAKLQLSDDRLTGTLQIPGMTIPLGKEDDGLEPISDRGEFLRFVTERNEDQFKRERQSLQLEVFVSDKQVFGRASRPSSQFGPLSFTLGADAKGYDPENVRRGLEGFEVTRPDGADEITIPSQGIPKSNSMAAVEGTTGQKPVADGERQVGFLQDAKYDDSISYTVPDSCGGEYAGQTLTSTWTVGLGTAGRKKGDYPYDAIEENDFKFMEYVSHFISKPDNIAPPEYEAYGVPEPTAVEYRTLHNLSEDTTQFTFDTYYPNGDDSDSRSGPDDGTIGLILDVISNANAYLGVATAVIDYLLDTDSESGLTANRSAISNNREEVYWKLPIGSSFPDSTDNTAGVEAEIVNSEINDGEKGYFNTEARWSFFVDGYPNGGCPNGFDSLVYEVTGSKYIQYCSFDGDSPT